MSDGTEAAAAAGGEGDAAAVAAAAAAGGGAAGLLGGQGGGDASAAAGGGDGGAWFDIFSDKPAGEGQTAARDWVKAKGWKDPDAMAASVRELEGKFLSGDKIVMPKEGDGADVFEAFHKAIGRPDAADKYDLKLGEGEEVNEDLAKVMREAAFKTGMPASMFAAIAEPFNEYMRGVLAQAEQAQSAQEAEKVQQRDAGVAEYKTEVGDKFNTHIAAGNKAMRLLELTGDDIAGIEEGLGTKKTLALFAKLGMGMGEDILLDAGGRPKFSLSKEEAQAKLDMLGKTEGYLEKLKSDPKLKAEREHLLSIVAAAETRERDAAG